MLKTLRLSHRVKKGRRKKKQAQEIAKKKCGVVNANKPSDKARKRLKNKVKNLRKSAQNCSIIDKFDTVVKKEIDDASIECDENASRCEDAKQGE